jgi:G3E family GTPase
VRTALERFNPAAQVLDVVDARSDVQRLLTPRELAARTQRSAFHPIESPAADALNRHGAAISSLSLALEEPLDWTAFGVWLSMLLNRHGANMLRVKGILNVKDSATPVFINAVQHIVHPPQHLERWPTSDRRSRIVFIMRGIEPERLQRSLAAFTMSDVTDVTSA